MALQHGGRGLAWQASGLRYEVDNRVTLKLAGDVDATWDYQFSAVDDNSTRIYREVTYDVDAPRTHQMVNVAVLDRINQHALDQMLGDHTPIFESDD